MRLLKIQTVEGRVAFTAPRGGAEIPSAPDFITVPESPWITRLLDHHADIRLVGDDAPSRRGRPRKNQDEPEPNIPAGPEQTATENKGDA